MKKILLILTTVLLSKFSFAQTTCATATVLSAVGSYITPTYTTSTFSGGCLSSRTSIKAIWYAYTPVSNGEITVSSDLPSNDGVTYALDTRVSVFKGSCTTLSCIGANDDVSSTNYRSSVTVPVAAGNTYYIQWDNYWGLDEASPNLGLNFTLTFNSTSCIRLSAYDVYLPDTYTATSATLYWNQAIGSPSNYDTDWSTTFTTPAGSGTIVNTSTLNAGPPAYATSTISGVPAGSNVRYYLRSNCGATQSAWQGPFYAYLAKTLPYSVNFDDVNKNYTDGFVGFSRLTTTATSTPPNYADGGAGTAMYTFNSTTAASNLRAYTRAVTLQAGETVTFNFKTRLYPATAVPMTFNVTVGNAQSATSQSTVLQSYTESSATAYTPRTATFTAGTTGVYHFGFHNNSPAGTVQSFLFFDTLEMTSVLSIEDFLSNKFNIYPNPVNDVLTIANSSLYEIKSVTITDVNGRTIKNVTLGNVTETQVNVGELTSGVYFLTIDTNNGNIVKKFVKN